MNHNDELVKNTLILSIGILVPKVISLAILPLMTTYLSTDEYGNYDLIVSFVSLIIPIMTLQIQQALFRKLLAVKEKTDNAFLITSAFLFLLVSFSVCVLFIYTITYFAKSTDDIVLYVCAMILAESFYTVIGQIVRGIGYNLIFSLGVVVYSVTNLVALVVLLPILDIGLKGVVVSLTAGYLFSAIYMLLRSKAYKYINICSFSIAKLKELLSFSMPIVPSSISLWIVNLSDRLVITAAYGVSLNGIYSVANKIPQLYSTAYGVFNLAWTETAARAFDDGDPSEYYTQLFQTLYRFLIGIMLLLLAITPWIFIILVNPEYKDAYYQIPILYFGVFFNSIVQFYSGIYIALKHTKGIGISSAVGALINLIINIMLVQRLGLYAASISTLVSYLCIVLYRKWDLKNLIYIRYNKKEIIVGICLFVLGAYLCYQGQVISSILCLIISIVYNVYYNRKLAIMCINTVVSKIKR